RLYAVLAGGPELLPRQPDVPHCAVHHPSSPTQSRRNPCLARTGRCPGNPRGRSVTHSSSARRRRKAIEVSPSYWTGLHDLTAAAGGRSSRYGLSRSRDPVTAGGSLTTSRHGLCAVGAWLRPLPRSPTWLFRGGPSPHHSSASSRLAFERMESSRWDVEQS